MANTFKFGNKNWAWKEDYVLAYNDENNNFKPLPFDFTRASTATTLNRQGLIEVVPSGKPRIDFTDNTSGHLLLEPSRTNLVTYSEDFSQWTLANSGNGSTPILTSNYSNDLGLNVSRVIFERTSASTSNTSTIRGNDYSAGNNTFSIYIKSNTSNVTIDFRLGSSITPQLITTEWQRLTFTGSSFYRSFFGLIGNDSDLYADLSIAAAQAEAGSYATSYIPTSGSSVTRAADDAANGGNSQVFDNDSAVWFIDCERIGVEGGRAITLENASGTEQLRYHFDAPSEFCRFRDPLSSYVTIGSSISFGAAVRKKFALRINGATLSVFANGSKVGSDYTRPTAFDIQKMHIYEEAFKLYDMRFYNTALSDSELQALTT